MSGARPASVLGRSAQADGVSSIEIDISSAGGPGLAAVAGPAEGGSAADQAVTTAYRAHYSGVVRLAFLLTGNLADAEGIAQDAYAAMHGAWGNLGGQGAVLPFLRRAVIAGSRASFPAAPRYTAESQPAAATAQPAAATAQPATATAQPAAGLAVAPTQPPAAVAGVLPALRGLPGRQREALVLKLYLDLPDAEIAEAMQVSVGTARAHVTGALAALRGVA